MRGYARQEVSFLTSVASSAFPSAFPSHGIVDLESGQGLHAFSTPALAEQACMHVVSEGVDDLWYSLPRRCPRPNLLHRSLMCSPALAGCA